MTEQGDKEDWGVGERGENGALRAYRGRARSLKGMKQRERT